MAVSVPETANLTDPVFDNARVHPDAAAFSVQTDGRWRTVTAREFAEQVVAVAKGLIAMGVDAGDRVGLMARTCYEWTLLDYAIWSAGAITVPVYETSSAEQVAWYLADSQAVAVVVETGDHATIVEAAQPSCPALRHVWRIDSDAVGTLTGAGRDVPDGAVAERRATLSGSTVATLIYTLVRRDTPRAANSPTATSCSTSRRSRSAPRSCGASRAPPCCSCRWRTSSPA